MNVDRIRYNLESLRYRIALAASRAGRPAESVRLIAVTKKCPAEWARSLVASGACDLGENYPQELWSKAEALADLGDSLHWHLIGHLQTNKLKKTLPLVTMIHSVDSIKLLEALDAAAAAASPRRLEVCLQVNTSDEPNKHGWSPAAILAEASAIAACQQVAVVGLMTMAAYGTSAETARGSFILLRETRDRLSQALGSPLNHLSMGMSNDFETAIEEGATLVRVGSALFEGVE
jgi:pyridoxal phosphate enzyme (YggS family)